MRFSSFPRARRVGVACDKISILCSKFNIKYKNRYSASIVAESFERNLYRIDKTLQEDAAKQAVSSSGRAGRS